MTTVNRIPGKPSMTLQNSVFLKASISLSYGSPAIIKNTSILANEVPVTYSGCKKVKF
jgi:hypothetical protein